MTDSPRGCRILVVDDDPDLLELVAVWLAGLGCRPCTCTRGQDALHVIEQEEVKVALVDVRMPEMDGFTLLEEIRRRNGPPVILMTVDSSVQGAVDAMKAGAFDYLPKPLAIETVRKAVEHAVEPQALRTEVARLKRTLDERYGRTMPTRAPTMARALELAERVVDANVPVLLTGESGVGKEVFAKGIHFGGPRRDEPFVAVNCAAIPSDLMESELFGHERGAFTGASRSRTGKFAEARAGTIFLDEVGELDATVQPKLLRVLQERTFTPVGATGERPLQARILAATNRDLDTEVAAGRFREDLYYRLNVVNIEIPPLRERREDIPDLVTTLLHRFNEAEGRGIENVTPQAMAVLLDYDWPGNVRELDNVIVRAGLVTTTNSIDVDALPRKLQPNTIVSTDAVPVDSLNLAAAEERMIRAAMISSESTASAAARLGISRATLYRKLKKLDLDH